MSQAQWSFSWRSTCGVKTTKKDATVHRQPRSTLCCMFVQPFSFVSCYFLELTLMISFFIYRRHITAGWGRDMGMILQPTWILIRIYGWRQDRLVGPIEIGCTNSPTLQSRTCRRPVVSQLLGARNQYRAPNLESWRPYKNIRPISMKNMNDSLRIMKNSVEWSWIWDHRWVVYVHSLFGPMVPGTTSLLLLFQHRLCSSLILFEHINL
jgi:hypothetical protein